MSIFFVFYKFKNIFIFIVRIVFFFDGYVLDVVSVYICLRIWSVVFVFVNIFIVGYFVVFLLVKIVCIFVFFSFDVWIYISVWLG